VDLQPIVNNVIVVVVGIITLVGVLAPFILPLVKKIKNDNLRRSAEEWVAYAEQVASGNIKSGDPAMPSALKYDIAAKGLTQATGVSADKARLLIEAVLGAARLANGKK